LITITPGADGFVYYDILTVHEFVGDNSNKVQEFIGFARGCISGVNIEAPLKQTLSCPKPSLELSPTTSFPAANSLRRKPYLNSF
jgi:hypothetical protein